ncbi:MAG: hypothetical protein ACREH8_08525 [Opitutaceae bacterium]
MSTGLPGMRLSPALVTAATLLAGAGCITQKPTTSTSMEPAIRAKVEKGVIEPGFTPEMVYLALGKPSEPAESLADATTQGTWVYHDFNGNGRDIVKPGFRRHVVSDPAKKTDVIKTEPIDPAALPNLRANSLHVTFRDGRVVEIQRVAGI